MNQRISNEISLKGFVVLRQHMPEKNTVDALSCLGAVLQLPGVELTQKLKPMERLSSTPNTYSGNYGLQKFPMHTDLAHWFIPPRYLALRCIVGSKNVATHIVDGNDIISAIGEDKLRRAIVKPRRPHNGQTPILRLLERSSSDDDILRWDSLFIRPASDIGKSISNEFNIILDENTPCDVFLINPGDTIIIDNWRMLHGRAVVTEDANNRLIERIYLGEIH